MTKTLQLNEGQTAIVITPGPDDTFSAEKYSVLPPNTENLTPEEGAEILFYHVLAVGLMHLAVDDTELVLNAGEDAIGAGHITDTTPGYVN